MQGMLPPKAYQAAKTLVLTVGIVLLGLLATLVVGYVMASPTFGWTGTFDLPKIQKTYMQSDLIPQNLLTRFSKAYYMRDQSGHVQTFNDSANQLIRVDLVTLAKVKFAL